MKKTNKLFNVFLLISLVFTVLGTIFSLLALFSTYTEAEANIKTTSFASILFIVFASLSFILTIAQAIVIKDYKVTRAKDNMIFIKVASAILILALLVLVLYDFIMTLVGISSSPVRFETWKFFRIIVSFLFIASLILTIFQEKIKVPSFVRYACALGPVAFCLFSDLAIYFSPGPGTVPEFFRITFSVAYIFGALFALYDFKWNTLGSSTKIYVLLTTFFVSFGLMISFSSIIFIFFGNLTSGHAIVNLFEAFVLLLFSIFALSKLIALKRAVSITAKSEPEKSDTPSPKKQ